MADGGVSLSLDDYIKVKRKQGGFKTKPGAAKGRPQQRRGGAKAVQQRGRGQKKAGNQARQQRRPRQAAAGGDNRYFNTAVVPTRKNQTARSRVQQYRGMRNQLSVAARGNNRSQNQVGGGRNAFRGLSTARGNSQNRFRVNRRPRRNIQAQIAPLIRQNGSQLQVNNSLRGYNNTVRPNKRRMMKLVQKRVQRARLQLTRPRVGVSAGRGIRRGPLRGLLPTQSGVRSTRNGFVTVRSTAEKQLQRLVIQEKIERARMARNGIPTGNRNQNRNRGTAVSREAVLRVQVSNDRRRDQYQRSRGPPPPPVRRHEYDPYSPSTMYADQVHYGMVKSERDHAHWSPPIVRTTTNNEYRSRTMQQEDDYGQTLNPEIQRKISFIQSQSRLRTVDTPGIIPDFRGPVSSSTVKLGDRFRLYMH